MANIEINEALWNSVSDDEKVQVMEHLKKHKILMDGDSITGNPSIPVPDVDSTDERFSLGARHCRLICDVTAATAAAALIITGPAYVAALTVIEAARQLCREAC